MNRVGHYVATIEVRYHEVGPWGEARPAVYLRYLEQAAAEAVSAAGFGPSWHAAAGGYWLVRGSAVEVPVPAHGGERLEVETWVESFGRVRSLRRYLVRKGPGGIVVLRGVTDWVYVDRATGRPRRVPDAMVGALRARGVRGGSRSPLRRWPVEDPPRHSHLMVRRVELRDLDGLGHVNNGTYLDYLAEAALGALATAGWGLERLAACGSHPRIVGTTIDYLGQAVYGDELRCRTWAARVSPERIDFLHVLERTAGQAVARAKVSWAWADASGSPEPLPRGLADDLVGGGRRGRQ